MEVHSKDISLKYLFIHQGEPGAVGLPGQPGVPGEDGATGKKVILLFSYYQSVKTIAPKKHLRPPGPRLTLPRADFICENEPSSHLPRKEPGSMVTLAPHTLLGLAGVLALTPPAFSESSRNHDNLVPNKNIFLPAKERVCRCI